MDMLGQQGRERAWSQIYELFVEPELDKRSDIAWENVYKVLIKLPKDKEPIVEFNHEVRFLYAMEDPVARYAGGTLQYYEIREIKEVLPPKVGDRNVAFIYAWRKKGQIYFGVRLQTQLA